MRKRIPGGRVSSTIAVWLVALFVVACGDGPTPSSTAENVEVGAPAPSARPYFFHSLFEYTSAADLQAFVSEITALPPDELPMRIGWRTQETAFPGVTPTAEAMAMASIDSYYTGAGLAPPSYTYTPYEEEPWTPAQMVSAFTTFRSAASAHGTIVDEILVERPVGGTSVAFVRDLKSELSGVSIAVSTTHLALESGCGSTAAAWDRFYLQFYSIPGVDVCLSGSCSSAYCGAGAPTSLATRLAGLATSPCRTQQSAFVFMSSYEEATDTTCSDVCTTCKPGLMGGDTTVFTSDRYDEFAEAFSAAVTPRIGFAPLLGVYVARNAMLAWSARSRSDYTPYKAKHDACSCAG